MDANDLKGHDLQGSRTPKSQRKHPLPPIEWLATKFTYNPETGQIFDSTGKNRATKGPDGRAMITGTHDGQRYNIFRSRLAFALQEKRWPVLVDHINRDPTDDRWTNLREATHSENRRNTADSAAARTTPEQIQRADRNAAKQAAFRQRRANAAATLQKQIDRLQGLDQPKAEQITAAAEVLSALVSRLIAPDDSATADEQAASYAAAAEITRARHHTAAALQILQDNDTAGRALENHLQQKARMEMQARRAGNYALDPAADDD